MGSRNKECKRTRSYRQWAAATMGVALGWIGLLLAGVARAQEGAAGTEGAAESRSQAFQAVEGAVKEDIAGAPLLLATYAVIWVVLFLYVFRLVGLQRRTQRELEGLRESLAASASSNASAPSGGE